MKIGKLVQKYIPEIFAYCEENPDELNNLLDEKYSKQKFGINFSFCREATIITGEKSKRYWKRIGPYDVCGKTVRVTNQWFDDNRPHFETYLKKKGIVNRKEVAENTTRDTNSEEDELVIRPAHERISQKKGIVPNSEEDEESGLEIEREDPEETITHPFNPERIKINTRHILVEQLVSRIKHKEIDLAPDFQRHRGIWNDEIRSRLIESLLLSIPIPVFYVAADKSDNWAVVDGVQRMSTIYDYVTGVFSLTRLEYLGLDGLKHDALPRSLQRRISETQLIVNVIEPGTPPEVMFNVFRRINTGGTMLNGQEIRHAIHPGPVRDYLKTLAESAEFIKATGGSIKPIRMADRECVLRFLAFYVHSPEKYDKGDLDGFLGNAMENINNMSSEKRDALGADFEKAMGAASAIFGEYAFRKRTSLDDRKRPISKILFEVWSVQLARCSPDQIRVLVKRREDVQRRFMQLIAEDDEFERAISLSTNTVRRVQKRFQAVKQLVEEFI